MLKRLFDMLFSLIALIVLGWLMVLLYVVATIDTGSSGLFTQQRVGRYGRLFTIYKLKTIHPKTRVISPVGWFLRRYKLDELPQFINIVRGNMSVVGPRPDIEGYYDKLEGESRKLLELKPGLLSEASLKYAHEEELLAQQANPLEYNDRIIFPDKVRLNLYYYYNQSFLLDLQIIFKTLRFFLR